MPPGTTVQQLVNDLRDGKSEIARKFGRVYGHCGGNVALRNQLAEQLRSWDGTADGLPNLATYGVAEGLTDVERRHIAEWPNAGSVINAMVRALLDTNRDIEFYWFLDLDDRRRRPSRSVIEPDAAGDPLPPPGATVVGTGGAGDIKVTFVTPRRMVSAIQRRDGEDHVDISVR